MQSRLDAIRSHLYTNVLVIDLIGAEEYRNGGSDRSPRNSGIETHSFLRTISKLIRDMDSFV